MGRAKQSLKLIKEGRTRNIAFRKRKEGLKKKAHELSVLCDVEVCLIMYGSPTDGSTVRDLEIWPPNRDNVKNLIDSYNKQSHQELETRTYNVFKFLEKRLQNIGSDLMNLRKRNDDAKYTTWDDRYNSFSHEQLQEIGSLLDVKLASAKERVEAIKSTQNCVPSSSHFKNDFALVQHQPISSSCNQSRIALPIGYYPFHQTHEQGQLQEQHIRNHPFALGNYPFHRSHEQEQVEEQLSRNHQLMMMNNSDSYHNSSNNLPWINRCSADTTVSSFSGPHGSYFSNNNSDTQMNNGWFMQMMKNLNHNPM